MAPPAARHGGLEVAVGTSPLVLLPERAAYLPDHATLLVADAHIGKAHSFRRLGVPVPGGTTGETLQRLDAALARTGARHVVFLGDLLHSARWRGAPAAAAVAAWRAAHADVALTLVRGNHDRHAGDPPADWGVQCVTGPLPLSADLALAHEPQALPGSYVLAGHVHPGVVLGGRAHERLRLPCFHFGERVGVLPAFGAFTGLQLVQPALGDRIFVVAGDTVRALPAPRAEPGG
jgi:DNA ligase-associated metallophosphoesterase